MNLTLMSLLVLIIVAAVCGVIGQRIAGYGRGGILVSIVVGFVGAILGLWIADNFDLPNLFTLSVDGQRFPIVWSIIGSALLVAAYGLFTHRGHRRGFFGLSRR
jgi:uncharacterized membrane protein YeaQ/YmgE (transglycosylase-associated protein family)